MNGTSTSLLRFAKDVPCYRSSVWDCAPGFLLPTFKVGRLGAKSNHLEALGLTVLLNHESIFPFFKSYVPSILFYSSNFIQMRKKNSREGLSGSLIPLCVYVPPLSARARSERGRARKRAGPRPARHKDSFVRSR